MENPTPPSLQQPPPSSSLAAAAAAAPPPISSVGRGAVSPFQHPLVQQQQQQLQMFWSYQRQEMEHANDFKNHQLPLARIKKIMKADEDVRMISAEAPILFAKACELFILELTIRSWLHAEENKRRTLQKNDIAAAITRTDIFDFLVDVVPRDDHLNNTNKVDDVLVDGLIIPQLPPPSTILGGGPNNNTSATATATASGVPFYYPPPMGQMMMIGRPATAMMDPYYLPPPSQAWQSVWQQPTPDVVVDRSSSSSSPPYSGNVGTTGGGQAQVGKLDGGQRLK